MPRVKTKVYPGFSTKIRVNLHCNKPAPVESVNGCSRTLLRKARYEIRKRTTYRYRSSPPKRQFAYFAEESPVRIRKRIAPR